MCDIDRSVDYPRSGLSFRQLDFRLSELPDDLPGRVSLLPHQGSCKLIATGSNAG